MGRYRYTQQMMGLLQLRRWAVAFLVLFAAGNACHQQGREEAKAAMAHRVTWDTVAMEPAEETRGMVLTAIQEYPLAVFLQVLLVTGYLGWCVYRCFKYIRGKRYADQAMLAAGDDHDVVLYQCALARGWMGDALARHMCERFVSILEGADVAELSEMSNLVESALRAVAKPDGSSVSDENLRDPVFTSWGSLLAHYRNLQAYDDDDDDDDERKQLISMLKTDFVSMLKTDFAQALCESEVGMRFVMALLIGDRMSKDDLVRCVAGVKPSLIDRALGWVGHKGAIHWVRLYDSFHRGTAGVYTGHKMSVLKMLRIVAVGTALDRIDGQIATAAGTLRAIRASKEAK